MGRNEIPCQTLNSERLISLKSWTHAFQSMSMSSVMRKENISSENQRSHWFRLLRSQVTTENHWLAISGFLSQMPEPFWRWREIVDFLKNSFALAIRSRSCVIQSSERRRRRRWNLRLDARKRHKMILSCENKKEFGKAENFWICGLSLKNDVVIDGVIDKATTVILRGSIVERRTAFAICNSRSQSSLYGVS